MYVYEHAKGGTTELPSLYKVCTVLFMYILCWVYAHVCDCMLPFRELGSLKSNMHIAWHMVGGKGDYGW